MGKLIVFFIGLAILMIIASLVMVYFRRKRSQETAREKGWAVKGDLNALQERAIILENDQAAEILRSLVAPPSDLHLGDDVTLLGNGHRMMIDSWLKSHTAKTNRKGLPR